jgi:hypothetical protein
MVDKTFIIIALGMIITGSVNTISTKLADVTSSENRYGEKTQFNHPFVQVFESFLISVPSFPLCGFFVFFETSINALSLFFFFLSGSGNVHWRVSVYDSFQGASFCFSFLPFLLLSPI